MQIPGFKNLRPLVHAEAGSGGILCLAERDTDNLTVVVKLLRNPTPDRRRLFAREVRALRAAGNHPRVVNVLCANLDGPQPYLVIPYFAGGALTRWIGRFAGTRLQGLALEIASGISLFHANGIAHGDVKPDNVFVAQTGSLHVGDPLGNGSGCTLSVGNWGGTPGYWAPEIAARQSAMSKAADVYSFGATLFEMATGYRPTDEDGVDANLIQNAPVIRRVVDLCCRRNPADRPTIGKVLEMLREQPVVETARPSGGAGEFLGALALLGLVVWGINAGTGSNGK